MFGMPVQPKSKSTQILTELIVMTACHNYEFSDKIIYYYCKVDKDMGSTSIAIVIIIFHNLIIRTNRNTMFRLRSSVLQY